MKMSKKLKRNAFFEEVEEDLLSDTWVTVDADNNFVYDGVTYVISESCEQYKVLEKYNEIHDYKNKAIMSKILVIHLKNNFLRFLDEKFEEVMDVSIDVETILKGIN